MTLTLLSDRGDGSMLLQGTAATVGNSSATTSINELLGAGIGDIDVWSVRLQVTGIATITTDAASLAEGVTVNVIDPAATVLDLLGVMKVLKTGTDRVDSFWELQGGRRQCPWVAQNGGIRVTFRSPDSNAAATGSALLLVSCRRRRQP